MANGTIGGGRDELSRSLRALRTQAGLSQRQAAAKTAETPSPIVLSQTQITRMETTGAKRGKVPTPDEVTELCDVYGAPSGERARLVSIARQHHAARPDERVILWRTDSPLYQYEFGRIEAGATRIRSYQPVGVLGILQTPAYAAVVMADGEPLSDEDAAAWTDARNQRRDKLADPAREWVLIQHVSAFDLHMHSPAVMAEQLDWIAEVSHYPNVTIGVVPMQKPMNLYQVNGFHLYDTRRPDGAAGLLAVSAQLTGTAIMEGDYDTAAYEHRFQQIAERAMYGDDARSVLARVADEYRAMGS